MEALHAQHREGIARVLVTFTRAMSHSTQVCEGQAHCVQGGHAVSHSTQVSK